MRCDLWEADLSIDSVEHIYYSFLSSVFTSRMISFYLLCILGVDEMLSVRLKWESRTTWRHNMWIPNEPDQFIFEPRCQPHIGHCLAHCVESQSLGKLTTHTPCLCIKCPLIILITEVWLWWPKTVSGPPNCMEIIPSIWNWISIWANVCVSLV